MYFHVILIIARLHAYSIPGRKRGNKMAVKKLTNTAVEKLQSSDTRQEYRDAEIKGLLVRVYPSGKKSFMLNYARGKYITLGDANVLKVAEARELARLELGKVAAGKDPAEARKRKAAGTFADYFKNHYQAHIEQNQKGAKQALVRYRYLCTQVGKVPLSDFTAFRINKFQSQRKKEGVSDATINRDVSAILAMLRHAVNMSLLTELPLKGKVQKNREPLENPRYLFPEEESRLREALATRDAGKREERKRYNEWRQERDYPLFPEIGLYSDYLAPLVLTAMLTGLRRGELFNLAWQDIDLQAGEVVVRAKGAKSGKTRTVPLRDECREVLATWKQLTEYSQPGDYVFPNKKGERLDNVKTSFSNLLKAADITGFRFHDLRHHCASMLVQADVSLYTVKEWLGHSDFKMTQRYAHLAPDNLKEAARTLDSKQSRAIGQVEDIKHNKAV